MPITASRHCFHILALFRINDFNLLSEEACFKEHPVKDGCLSGKVAFHPFKDSDMYTECMHQAQRSQALGLGCYILACRV